MPKHGTWSLLFIVFWIKIKKKSVRYSPNLATDLFRAHRFVINAFRWMLLLSPAFVVTMMG